MLRKIETIQDDHASPSRPFSRHPSSQEHSFPKLHSTPCSQPQTPRSCINTEALVDLPAGQLQLRSLLSAFLTMAASAGAAAAIVGKRASSPGNKALFRGIVFSTLAVATGDYICQQLEGEDEDGREGEVLLGQEQLQLPQHQQPQIRATPTSTTKKEWDKERTLRMAAATAVVMAPTSWMIVMRLEKFFPGRS